MMGVVGYLHERESGSFRSSRFRRCKQNVKDWLERLSASPALNQVRIFILFLVTILVLVCYFLLVLQCFSSRSLFDLWPRLFGCHVMSLRHWCHQSDLEAVHLRPVGYNVGEVKVAGVLLLTLDPLVIITFACSSLEHYCYVHWHYHCTNTVVVVLVLHCHQFAVRSFFHSSEFSSKVKSLSVCD